MANLGGVQPSTRTMIFTVIDMCILIVVGLVAMLAVGWHVGHGRWFQAAVLYGVVLVTDMRFDHLHDKTKDW